MVERPENLAASADVIQSMSPQDPRLPMQDALLAFDKIGTKIDVMTLVLLDASAGTPFILGDTPLPQSALEAGFCVPLSKEVALEARPAANPTPKILNRRRASAAEVASVNRDQWTNTLNVAVGPDANVLRAL